MLLLLRRDPEQDAALANLLTAQQDPASSLFHKWLTPEQFGEWFGPSDQDVATVTGWLASHGFSEIRVTRGHIAIEFNGSAGQVESAFHASIHRYQVSGVLHFANAADPSIPTALVPVVAGPVSLNDFGYRSQAIRGPTLEYAKGQSRPQIVPGENPYFTFPAFESMFYGVAPYDFATIYDLLPLWSAGLDGTGQTIAIVGETDINPNDPAQFRAFFGLPPNNPLITIAGTDPGVQPDETEADLDVEWSGAVAKGAQINLVSSASTETTQGVDLSALYIVDNNLAPVMSESYGGCELFAGTAANAFEAAMWQQASAQGITVLVSSGDEGSSECDPTNSQENLAVHPMAVNALASTPYNIAVGGTDFNQHNSWSSYWSANNDPATKESALGYIPEIPWNASCASTTLDAIYGESSTDGCSQSPLVVTNLNTIATGGGPSSCISSNGSDPTTCTGGWPKPLWQTGAGVPSDGVRDIPDVSLFASNGVYDSAYIVCQVDASAGSGCDPSAATQTFLAVGGTSASAPAMAGVMAIVNQKFGRQGNANPTLYRLASSAAGPSIFHDITTDGNRVACESPDPDCQLPSATSTFPFGQTSGHDSTAGYDMVTGLGSIDIANLVNHWNSVTFTSTSTSLTLDGGTGTVTAVHGAPIQTLAAVSASSGKPTGNVSIIGAQPNGSILLGTLNAGSVAGAIDSLPGGSYTVSARYGGDANFAPSQSMPVSVDISPEPSATGLSILNYDITSKTFVPAASPLSYGSLLLLRSDVTGQSGHGVATGSVTLTDSGNTIGQFALNAQGFTEYLASNPISGGTHALSASYAGDSSFNSSAGTNSVTLTPVQMSCSLTPNTYVLRPGWTLSLSVYASLGQNAAAPALANMVAPTGAISIYSGSKAVVGPTPGLGNGGGILGSGIYQIPGIGLPTETLQISQLTSVTAPITVNYAGDPNYASCTSAPLQLTYETGPIASSTSGGMTSPNSVQPGTPITIDIQVGPSSAPPIYEPLYPAPTGTLQVSVDGASFGSPLPLTTVSGVNGSAGYGNYGEATVTIPTGNLSLAEHNVTVTYSGDTNYLPGGGPMWAFFVYVPDFSLNINPQSLTVVNGQTTAPVSVSASTSNGFTGAVSFSCSGLPAQAACAFSPSTVTLTAVSGGGSTSLTITTTQAQDVPSSPVARNGSGIKSKLFQAGGISLACLLLVVAPRRWRKMLCLAIAASVGFAVVLTSCGGGSGSTGGGDSMSPTSTMITATTTTPAKGQNDTFTATVTGGQSTPTGTVQFSVDGVASGSPVELNNGAAQFVTSFVLAGAHNVSGIYSGDSSHDGSAHSVGLSVPYTTGSIPGTYSVTITATSGALTHNAVLSLEVN